MIRDLVVSMRPWQWYKNSLVFVALVFSGNLFNIRMFTLTVLGSIVFCIASSSQYIFNDIIDRERDMKHPIKSRRPIASGRLPPRLAAIYAALLLLTSLLISINLGMKFTLILVLYFTLNALYSLLLKHLLLIDVLAISTGFVLRAIAGALVINVAISPWLILCTFLLALFLALCKRMNELVLLSNAAEHRKVLTLYSKEGIEQLLSITTSMVIISYSLYTFFSGHYEMMATIPVVIYALFRYLLLSHLNNFEEGMEILFKDRGIIFSILTWLLAILVILYLG